MQYRPILAMYMYCCNVSVPDQNIVILKYAFEGERVAKRVYARENDENCEPSLHLTFLWSVLGD